MPCWKSVVSPTQHSIWSNSNAHGWIEPAAGPRGIDFDPFDHHHLLPEWYFPRNEAIQKGLCRFDKGVQLVGHRTIGHANDFGWANKTKETARPEAGLITDLKSEPGRRVGFP